MKKVINSIYIYISIIILGLLYSCKLDQNSFTSIVDDKPDEIVQNNYSLDDNTQFIENMSNDTNIDLFDHGEIIFDKKAIKLNDEAMKKIIYARPPVTKNDTFVITDAISLLDKAISIDSTYYLAYANKATLLSCLNRMKESLAAMKAIIRIKPDYAEGYVYIGIIYEKLGLIDSAKINYNNAHVAYCQRIVNTNLIEDKINSAFVLSLVDKEKGTKEMESLIENNPENETLLYWKKRLFDRFNREEFIKNN